ncbi:MAG: phytochelatin synthase family protein [Alphaproteobacteria bacterium]
MKNKLVTVFLLIILSNPLFADEIASKSNKIVSTNNTSSENKDNFYSEDGLKKLLESQFKNDFFQLINFYQPQNNPLFCSIAVGVTVLNALEYSQITNNPQNQIIKNDNDIIEYKLHSQQSFLNAETDLIKDHKAILFQKPVSRQKINNKWVDIFDPGLTLDELAQILEKVYKLKVEKINVTNTNNIEQFNETVKKTLLENNKFIIVNFDGKVLNKTTNGHMALLGAYHQNLNEILIIDPALHKNKWFWTKSKLLYNAMNTKDSEQFRGYLIVSK